MSITPTIASEPALSIGMGVRVMLLTGRDGTDLAHRIGGLGGLVEHETDIFSALETVLATESAYGVFVMDCTDLGGIDAGRTVLKMLGTRCFTMKIILISDVPKPAFHGGPGAPTTLCAPVSDDALHAAFTVALRDRLVFRAA